MGAYTTSSASEFNGFPKPNILWQDDGWIGSVGKISENTKIDFPVQCQSSISLSVR
jgi:hypothetical protein